MLSTRNTKRRIIVTGSAPTLYNLPIRSLINVLMMQMVMSKRKQKYTLEKIR